jgi:2-isopropylmalate synthase
MPERIKIIPYDTTLRDGTQTPDVKLTVGNKLRITQRLDEVGFPYIEGGWPDANPTDRKFFRELKGIEFKNAQLVAFGMTGKIGVRAAEDDGLQALLESETAIVTIFGKSWMLHVKDALRTTGSKNLNTIHDSIEFLRRQGRVVFYDAEHFYDGYKENAEYALETIKVARDAGAEVIILCDTNGGSMPEFIYKATRNVKKILGNISLGIHVHNDGGLAVANTLAAVKAGAVQVQGTINGSGERTGNVDFCVFLPTAEFKYGIYSGLDLRRISELSRFVEIETGFVVPPNTPYVGANAFTHKGGVHVSAVTRNPRAYEHIDPSLVGAQRRFEHSDQGGSANIEVIAKKFGLDVSRNDPQFRVLVEQMKKMKILGDAQEFLLLHRILCREDEPFDVFPPTKVVISREGPPIATVQVRVGGDIYTEEAIGKGGLHAFDLALKKALFCKYPQVKDIELTGYRVILPLTEMGTEAEVEVYIEFGANGERWTSRSWGRDEQIANQNAVIDGYKYYILRS